MSDHFDVASDKRRMICLVSMSIMVSIGYGRSDSLAQETVVTDDTADQLPDDPAALVKLIILSDKTISELVEEDDELDIFGYYKHVKQVVAKAYKRKGFQGVRAYEKLCRSNDDATFRLLETYLEDRRLGVTLTGNHCESMSWSAFYALSGKLYRADGLKVRRYARDQTRLGTDGRYHETPQRFGRRTPPRKPFALPQPQLKDDQLSNPWKLRTWLNERKGKTVSELRIEVLTSLAEAEKAVGFPNEGDREKFLDPIERQIAKLAAEAAE